MGTRLGRGHSDPAQTVRLEDFDDPGVANGHVEVPSISVEEDHVGGSRQIGSLELLARAGIQRDEGLPVTGAEQPRGHRIQVESVRAYARDRYRPGHAGGTGALDDN